MFIMRNANKRIIIYLVIVVLLLIFLIVESQILKSKIEEKKETSAAQKSEEINADDKESSYLTQANAVSDNSTEVTNPQTSYTPSDKNGNISKLLWNQAASVYGKSKGADEACLEMKKLLEEYGSTSDEGMPEEEDFRIFFDYWDETNGKGFVNNDGIPVGLPDDDSLCIVVLGYALYPDGGMRDELKLRLDEGYEAAEKYPNALVLVTGGGTALGAPSIKEADKMAKYLEEKGLDPSRIIVENNSMTTAENAVFCEMLLKTEYPQVKEIAIVTSDYHVPLGCQIFQGWFIMTGSYLKVSSNAACHPGNPTTFGIRDQVFWMEELTGYL